jgi:hypothetical protein
MATVFFSYSHKDEALRERLETSLKTLERQGLIEPFHDRRIPPGDVLDHAIDAAIERANVILLLVSSDFLASSYCMDREMPCALKRHRAGEARVIPIILRPCEWRQTQLKELTALPKDGQPISKYPDLDDAFLEVTGGIRLALAAAGAAPQRLPLLVHPRSEQNFVYFGRDNYEENAEFSFSAAFHLTARTPLTITSFRCTYWTRGCPCQNNKPRLHINGMAAPMGPDYYLLRRPLHLSQDTTVLFEYGRDVRPPVGKWKPADCTDGDLEVTIQCIDRDEKREWEFVFQVVGNGTLVERSKVREPRCLGNSVLLKALEEHVITQIEFDIAAEFTPWTRWLALLGYGGEKIPESTIALLKQFNQKIIDKRVGGETDERWDARGSV